MLKPLFILEGTTSRMQTGRKGKASDQGFLASGDGIGKPFYPRRS